MDFFLKNLRETLEALNELIGKNIKLVNCKRVRQCQQIKSSDRSKVNFIWRTLKYLADEGSILEKNGSVNPISYYIKPKEKIDLKVFIKSLRLGAT